MKNVKSIITLFCDFFKIGMFTFGGGWSIVAQMQKLYVEDLKVISNEELIDLTGVGRSLPGIMIVNVSMLFGHRFAGYPGGLACILGISMPPFIVLTIITFFYTAFKDSALVAAAMFGVRAAVVPIIAYAARSMVKSSIRCVSAFFIAALAFFAYHFVGLGCLWIILLSAATGIVLAILRDKKGGTVK